MTGKVIAIAGMAGVFAAKGCRYRQLAILGIIYSERVKRRD